MGVWRAHGLDEVLRECWRRGIVLCGLSAGSLCWFSEAVTAFHGPPQRVRGARACCHTPTACTTTANRRRRESYHRFLSEGMAPGYAAGDGAALHFRGESLAQVVSSRPKASAFWVEEAGDELSEVALQVRWLGGSRTLSAA